MQNFLNKIALQYKEKSKEAERIFIKVSRRLSKTNQENTKEVKQKLKETSGIRTIFDAFKR